MSRRSSDTSADDDRSRADSFGMSLEYDDISLDLISETAKETERRILSMIPDLDQAGSSNVALLSEDAEVGDTDGGAPPEANPYELDQLLPHEMITDLGRRSCCDYDVQWRPGNGDVFIPRNPPRLPDIPDTNEHEISRGYTEFVRDFCIAARNPLRETPTRAERIVYALRCPPHGRIGRVLTFVVGVTLLWGTTWSIAGREALPGGNIFALFVLTLSGYSAGVLAQTVHLPPILGTCVHASICRQRLIS